MSADPLRIALLLHTVSTPPAPGPEQYVVGTAQALLAHGHQATVISSHPRPTQATEEHGVHIIRTARLPEAPLRYRGFTGPLTHAPLALRALTSGGYDVVHAFSPEDAAIALRSRRRTGTPVVYTAAEPLRRETLAHRRLRLRLVQAAVEETDAVTAPTAELAAIAARWLAVDAELIDPGDAAAIERVYRRLIATRTR